MTRPTRIHVVADHTPGIHRTATLEAMWWLPILGPTATWLAVILAAGAEAGRDEPWPTGELADRLGLKDSLLWRAVDRLHRYGVLTFPSTDVATVRLELPPLPQGRLSRLPAAMADAYPQPVTAEDVA